MKSRKNSREFDRDSALNLYRGLFQRGMKLAFIVTVVGCLLILSIDPAEAHIYSYKDKNGVLHFTNTPTDPNFALYMKESPRESGAGDTLVYDSETFDPIIRKAGVKHGLDFSLIKAVIRTESGFNPRAVSKKGAKGLMQIMPENFKNLSVKDPFDPSQNIMAGAMYLKRLLTRYQNKLSLALAAYNAGPTAVDKYQKIPPYDETVTYVRKVMSFYSQYKNI